MGITNVELKEIVQKFAASGWDLIEAPSKEWLAENGSLETTATLLSAIEQAEKECGSCGCEFDPLYKKAIVYLKTA